jgi:hypothetical protein
MKVTKGGYAVADLAESFAIIGWLSEPALDAVAVRSECRDGRPLVEVPRTDAGDVPARW